MELVLSLNVILVYAAIAQRMLLMRTQKQRLLVVGSLACLILLALFMPFALYMAGRLLLPYEAGYSLWSFPVSLFVPLPLMPPQKELAEAFPVLLGQWSIVGFLSWQLMQQLRRTGKSDEKALLRG